MLNRRQFLRRTGKLAPAPDKPIRQTGKLAPASDKPAKRKEYAHTYIPAVASSNLIQHQSEQSSPSTSEVIHNGCVCCNEYTGVFVIPVFFNSDIVSISTGDIVIGRGIFLKTNSDGI